MIPLLALVIGLAAPSTLTMAAADIVRVEHNLRMLWINVTVLLSLMGESQHTSAGRDSGGWLDETRASLR